MGRITQVIETTEQLVSPIDLDVADDPDAEYTTDDDFEYQDSISALDSAKSTALYQPMAKSWTRVGSRLISLPRTAWIWIRGVGSWRACLGRWWANIGNLAWIFTTSMILVGLPLLYAYDREKSLQDHPGLSLEQAAPAAPPSSH